MTSSAFRVKTRSDGVELVRKSDGAEGPAPKPQPWFTRSLTLGVGLLTFYFIASLAMDPSGYLSSDTGGKTATVAGMSERGDWSPEIGYWAQELDPNGDLHPYFGTSLKGDVFINVTSLPMILAARPLWDLGGERAVLLLPMLGSIGAALAAGQLSRRFGAQAGWPAVLLIGLASPAAIYALDFWEHSIGLALMAWGFVFVLDVIGASPWEPTRRTGGSAVASGLAAGLCFGFAANLRQEALVYGFVAGVVLCAGLYQRDKRPQVWLPPSAAMAFGAIAMLGANILLELAVFGGANRVSRSTASISDGGSAGIILRFLEAAVTFASPMNFVNPISALMAIMVTAGLIGTTMSYVRPIQRQRPVALLGVIVLALVLKMFKFGPSFVPGLLAAAPMAGAGIALGWLKKSWTPLAMALVPLPLVWFYQYTGAAAPQWGGRYILASGLLLSAYAMGQWSSYGDTFSRWIRALMAASVAITLIGLAFMSELSHGMADGTQLLADNEQPVLIFAEPFLARSAGPIGVEERWLATWGPEERAQAADLVQEAGFDSFGYVGGLPVDGLDFEGFKAGEVVNVVFIDGFETTVTTYERVP